MIILKQCRAEIEREALERATRLPSSLAPKSPRPKFIHSSDAIRHTPKRRSLSEMDGERTD